MSKNTIKVSPDKDCFFLSFLFTSAACPMDK